MVEFQYQLLPDLSAAEYAQLKADIAARGVQVPVEYDEQGNILDGFHRVRACGELGIADWPKVVRVGMTDDQKVEHALMLNLARRHLTSDQRADLVVKLREQGWSTTRIAEKVGVSDVTVWRDLAGSTFVEPERITGADGKSYPARRPVAEDDDDDDDNDFDAYEFNRQQILEANRQGAMIEVPNRIYQPARRPVAVYNPRPAEMQLLADPEIAEMLVSGAATTVAEAKHERARHKRENAAPPAPSLDAPIIYHRDALEFLCTLADGSIDLLLTDPPYMTEVADIVAFAASWTLLALRKVKPTGRAYICTGAYPVELQAYLNVLLPIQGFTLANVLVWTYRNTLGPSPKFDYKQNWQAVFYLRGADAPALDCPLLVEQFSVQDINAPDGRFGVRYHTWQKPDELAERFVRHGSTVGDLVVDCFAGTGAFLLAAGRLGRRAVGCDSDDDMVRIAVQRGCVLGAQ